MLTNRTFGEYGAVFSLFALILSLVVFLPGCSEQTVEPLMNQSNSSTNDGFDEQSTPDLSLYDPSDRIGDNKGRGGQILATANCSWWNSLGQGGRNYRIVLEALYSVDRQIWGQNNRVTCSWRRYLSGVWGCYVPGDWDYSNRSNVPGYSGQCKPFVRELLQRASGGVASLPGGNTYNYCSWYPYRNRADGIRYAQPGEVMQLTGSRLHTAVIITNFHDGRFEVVDGNYGVSNRITKHVINVNTGAERTADLKFYLIDCY